MPQVDDRFAGHMETGDPRSLLFGARGAVWPTISAFRYRLQSTNATGSFSFFNGDGVLVTLSTALPATGPVLWEWFGTETPFPAAKLFRLQQPVDEDGYRWFLQATPELDLGFVQKTLVRPFEKTNKTVNLGSLKISFPDPGDTGTGLRGFQVEWDETMPPS